jgi:hypothetical protein
MVFSWTRIRAAASRIVAHSEASHRQWGAELLMLDASSERMSSLLDAMSSVVGSEGVGCREPPEARR